MLINKLNRVGCDTNPRRHCVSHRNKTQPAHLDRFGRRAISGNRKNHRASIDLDRQLRARVSCNNNDVAKQRNQRTSATIEPRAIDHNVTGVEVDTARTLGLDDLLGGVGANVRP